MHAWNEFRYQTALKYWLDFSFLGWKIISEFCIDGWLTCIQLRKEWRYCQLWTMQDTDDSDLDAAVIKMISASPEYQLHNLSVMGTSRWTNLHRIKTFPAKLSRISCLFANFWHFSPDFFSLLKVCCMRNFDAKYQVIRRMDGEGRSNMLFLSQRIHQGSASAQIKCLRFFAGLPPQHWHWI